MSTSFHPAGDPIDANVSSDRACTSLFGAPQTHRSGNADRPVGRLSELTDLELVNKFRAGRAAPVFEAELFRRVRKYASPELRSTVGYGIDLEDLLQEVVTKVWVNLGKYNPAQASFRTWVSRIARYTGLDSLRRASARPKSAVVLEGPDGECFVLGEVDATAQFAGAMTEESHVLTIVLEEYCSKRKNRAEAQTVKAVLGSGYRIADVKALLPSVAGNVDRWIKNARLAMRAAVLADVA